jgi:hypothetical protein
MGGTGNRIFVYAKGRGKASYREIKSRIGRRSCDDQIAPGRILEGSKIGPEVPDLIFIARRTSVHP